MVSLTLCVIFCVSLCTHLHKYSQRRETQVLHCFVRGMLLSFPVEVLATELNKLASNKGQIPLWYCVYKYNFLSLFWSLRFVYYNDRCKTCLNFHSQRSLEMHKICIRMRYFNSCTFLAVFMVCDTLSMTLIFVLWLAYFWILSDIWPPLSQI